MTLICKWGFDGTSGQSIYKMTFEDPNISDASLLFTSLVPSQLVGVNQETKKENLLWSNPKPSSTLFCRPLKLQFTKETEETFINEKTHFDKQIEQLQPLKTTIHMKNVFIQYSLSMTMLDSKVCNAINNTKSVQQCYLCQATFKQFNNIDEVLQRPVTTDYLQYGLSTLHTWIRCFECCIHLGYKKKRKKWQARKEEDKQEKATMKASIQNLHFISAKSTPKKLKTLLPEAVAFLVPVTEDYEDSDADSDETNFEYNKDFNKETDQDEKEPK
nr:uncharacterized protein LOC124807078 isoform X1 [Hydra vulgaris]